MQDYAINKEKGLGRKGQPETKHQIVLNACSGPRLSFMLNGRNLGMAFDLRAEGTRPCFARQLECLHCGTQTAVCI